MPIAPSGRYRLARPGVLLVHCVGAMGFGFGASLFPTPRPKPEPTPLRRPSAWPAASWSPAPASGTGLRSVGQPVAASPGGWTHRPWCA